MIGFAPTAFTIGYITVIFTDYNLNFTVFMGSVNTVFSYKVKESKEYGSYCWEGVDFQGEANIFKHSSIFRSRGMNQLERNWRGPCLTVDCGRPMMDFFGSPNLPSDLKLS